MGTVSPQSSGFEGDSNAGLLDWVQGSLWRLLDIHYV